MSNYETMMLHDPKLESFLTEKSMISVRHSGIYRKYQCKLCQKGSFQDKCIGRVTFIGEGETKQRAVEWNTMKCGLALHYSKYHKGIITLYKLANL